MLVGVSFILKEAKRVGFDEDKFLDICIITIVCGVIGARVYYVIFAWEYYKDNIGSIFNIRQGGLAIYGGVLAGIAAIVIISKIRHLKTLKVLDVAIMGVIIGQIFGRWGNFFNRECFGQYTDGFFAMLLPYENLLYTGGHGSVITQEMTEHLVKMNGISYISVHPTFLYEMLWNLALLIFLLCTRKNKKFDGQIIFTYLVVYGAGRFWIEGLRVDQLKLWGTNLAVSQVLAAILVVLGAGLYFYNWKKAKVNGQV